MNRMSLLSPCPTRGHMSTSDTAHRDAGAPPPRGAGAEHDPDPSLKRAAHHYSLHCQNLCYHKQTLTYQSTRGAGWGLTKDTFAKRGQCMPPAAEEEGPGSPAMPIDAFTDSGRLAYCCWSLSCSSRSCSAACHHHVCTARAVRVIYTGHG